MGEEVRFDGGHKRDPSLIHTLGRHVAWVHVCPEFEFGLGVPREPLRLVQAAGGPRVIAQRSGSDHTDGMRAWSVERVERLAALDLHGFVLKKNSPSCGLHCVKVYSPGGGAPARDGRGVFAQVLADRLRLLPLEEEGRLCDPRLRENFIERVFAYQRWTELLRDDASPRGLVRFHAAQKYALLAHSTRHYKALGQIVAQAGGTPWAELVAAYGPTYMAALGVLATPGKQTNVLQHLAGHLRRELDDGDRAELAEVIASYRAGLVPLAVPLTLLRHHFRRTPGNEWAQRQVYLNPHPHELMVPDSV